MDLIVSILIIILFLILNTAGRTTEIQPSGDPKILAWRFPERRVHAAAWQKGGLCRLKPAFLDSCARVQLLWTNSFARLRIISMKMDRLHTAAPITS